MTCQGQQVEKDIGKVCSTKSSLQFGRGPKVPLEHKGRERPEMALLCSTIGTNLRQRNLWRDERSQG